MSASRQARFAEALRRRGLRQVSVWVPENRVPEIHEAAAKLRAEEGALYPREERAEGDG